MSNVHVTADLHLGHRKIIQFSPERQCFDTIEDHDEAIIENWNRVVRKGDTVWVLGDVAFGLLALQKLSRLNGRKVLVMGNHDTYSSAEYLNYFSKLHGAMVRRGALFTHIPVHPAQLDRFEYNIHGHLHSQVIDDPRYINVSLERTNLTPVPLDQILPC